MAKKTNSSSSRSTSSRKPAAARAATPVRNSPVPKSTARSAVAPVQNPVEITHDMIAFRAWQISQSPECRTEFDNWIRAERELRSL